MSATKTFTRVAAPLSQAVDDMIAATQTYMGVNQLAATAGQNALGGNQQGLAGAASTYLQSYQQATSTVYTPPYPIQQYPTPLTGAGLAGGALTIGPSIGALGGGGNAGLIPNGLLYPAQMGQQVLWDAKTWFYSQLDMIEDQSNSNQKAYPPVPYDDRVNRLKDKRFFDVQKMDEQAIITFCLCNDTDPTFLIGHLESYWGAKFV